MKRQPNRILLIILLSLSLFLTACTKTEVKTEKVSIPYHTQRQDDSNLWEGEEKVVKDGISGEKEVTYKLIYKEGADQPPEREKLSEKVITEPKESIVKVGTRARGTGKKITSGAVEYELKRIERKSTHAFVASSGVAKNANGDLLVFTFFVKNLSQKNNAALTFILGKDFMYKETFKKGTIPTIAGTTITIDEEKDPDSLIGEMSFGQVYPDARVYFDKDSPEPRFGQNKYLKGDETGEMEAVYSLNPSNESVDPEKQLNNTVVGPENLTLVFNYDSGESGIIDSVGDDTKELEKIRIMKEGINYMKLTDLWIGPFYSD